MSTYHHIIVRFQLKGEDDMSKLVDLINELEEIIKSSPEFVSAKLHRNREGTLLVNYATWKSRRGYEEFWKEHVTQTATNKEIESYKPLVDQVFEVLR